MSVYLSEVSIAPAGPSSVGKGVHTPVWLSLTEQAQVLREPLWTPSMEFPFWSLTQFLVIQSL